MFFNLSTDHADCDYSIGASGSVPIMTMIASSTSNELHSATSIPLRLIPDIGVSGTGWIPDSSDSSPWIQADLKEMYSLQGIVTQGCGNENSWVKTYCLSYEQGQLILFYGGTSIEDCKVDSDVIT